MQTRQTKVLEAVFRRSLYEARETGYSSITPDHITLALLKESVGHSATILSKLLKEWELYQIRTRIERDIIKASPLNYIGFPSPADTSGEAMRRIYGDLGSTPGNAITTGHLLLAILRNRLLLSTRTLELYNVNAIVVAHYLEMLPESEEYDNNTVLPEKRLLYDIRQEGEAESQEELSPMEEQRRNESVLEKLGTDLTKAARSGRLDPVVGRYEEIERLSQILCRRKKNNPVLIGEAGVGKSAIVEGLALRIASGDVPQSLKDKTVFSLDVASLVSGTKYRGEFEQRLKGLLDELSGNRDVILFIDEIHTIVGAGSTQGSLDIANMLKPALARGELQCIGATTLDEFREHIESDSALERRFQKIIVGETSREDTLTILENIKGFYEEHHGVNYTCEALEACVSLPARYITDRVFPDKAIDVMDEAGSKARILRAASDSSEQYAEITADHILSVVASITGVNIERMSCDEQARLSDMCGALKGRVIGQEEAVEKVCRAIRRGRSGLGDPDKPIGVFMFVGPTGVGKTHLTKELARYMFGDSNSLIRVDMSEYSEKHNVSRLIGSPPGYVGYGKGGQLTEHVRRHPYSIVLFDEIEKAHPDVYNVMLQLFDEGRLTDGLGRTVDFRNTVVIMTSNVGSRDAAGYSGGVGYATSSSKGSVAAGRESLFRKSMEQHFSPEFLNRIDDIVVFNTLCDNDVKRIVELEFARLHERVLGLGYTISLSEEACRKLIEEGYEPRYGARSLKRTLLSRVEEPVSDLIIGGEIESGDKINVCYKKGDIALRISHPRTKQAVRA